MSILSNKKRDKHTYCCNTEKNNLFLQHDRRYPPKASIKRLPTKNGGLTALNGRIPPEEHHTLFGLSLKLRSARGPTDRIPQICQRAARYLEDLTGQYRWEARKKQDGSAPHTRRARPRSPPRTPKTPAAPEVSISFIPSRSAPLRSFRRIGLNRPGSHPIHRRTATLIYGQVDMTGKPRLFPEHLLL